MKGNFVYHNPTKLYFGPDSLNGLKEELKKYGPNIMLNVTIQFRPSCNQTKNPEVIPGIFCIGMAEVV